MLENHLVGQNSDNLAFQSPIPVCSKAHLGQCNTPQDRTAAPLSCAFPLLEAAAPYPTSCSETLQCCLFEHLQALSYYKSPTGCHAEPYAALWALLSRVSLLWPLVQSQIDLGRTRLGHLALLESTPPQFLPLVLRSRAASCGRLSGSGHRWVSYN